MKELGNSPITICPCCNGDDFSEKESQYEDGDRYLSTWVCVCGAKWLEEYTLAETILLEETRRGDD